MKQLLLIAIIHLLIFHQYKKDKSEALAPKKDSKPVQAIVHNDKDLYLSNKIRTKEKPDTANISVRSAPLRPIQAVYFLPAIPALIK